MDLLRILPLPLLALVTAGPGAPSALAQTPASMAADACVTYAEDGQNGYHLANSCDYQIEIAWCSQPAGQPALCLTNQSWTREILAAKAQGKGQVLPGHALDLFACRTPGAVEILPSGMARCMATPPAPVIPILSAASLKNPGGIIIDADYPRTFHDMEGTTRFDLMVDPDGRPLSCETTTSSGYVELDKAACNAFIRRARFSPAKDTAGNATTGKYRGSVTFKAP